LADKNNIEKYTREKNYGDKSFIKTKEDIKSMGLNTFFFSDASSVINRKVFEELGYYDGKRFASNEDQYIAHKLIMSGYRIKYSAESEVVHSHDFNFKTLYKRYQDTGEFYNDEVIPTPVQPSLDEQVAQIKQQLEIAQAVLDELLFGGIE
jgi:rhamnosyltransferase